MIDVPRGTEARLARLTGLILDASRDQNLIAASTIPDFGTRHLEDSLQLLPLLPQGELVDIGSGAGLPGLVLACCRADPVHLIEPRNKRAAFLADTARELGLDQVTVWSCRVEAVSIGPVRAITARAVAALPRLFSIAVHLSDQQTRWVLPKGRSAANEVAKAREAWQGNFSLVPSRTDPDAAIVVADAVRRRSP